MSFTGIRSATPDETAETIGCIVAAFLTDPLGRFAWPSPHQYLTGMALVARAFGGASFEQGTADVTANFCGAALWLPPGVHPDGEAVEQAFRDTAEPAHLDDLLGTFEKMDEWHPEERHWYLPLVGVEPNAQGRGLGGALMRHATARAGDRRSSNWVSRRRRPPVRPPTRNRLRGCRRRSGG